ncbi:MAG: hypothetical protein ACUVX8_09645 [Candidatus Zipacnadales bacterium]
METTGGRIRPLAVKTMAVFAGIVIVVTLTVLISLKEAHAQQPLPGGMPPWGPMWMGPGGPPPSGGIAMLEFEGKIYIAQDGTLYKINPNTMTLEGELRYLPRGPMPPLEPPATAQPR